MDLMRNVSVVCKQMRRLSYSRDVMGKVDLSEEDFSSSDQLYSFLAAFRQLGSLKVSICEEQPTVPPSLAAASVGVPRASDVLSSLHVKALQVKLKVAFHGPSRMEIEQGQCTIKGVESLKIVNYFGELLKKQEFTAAIIKGNCQTLKEISLKDMTQNDFCQIVLDSVCLCKNLEFLRVPINSLDTLGLVPTVRKARIDINAEFDNFGEFKASRIAKQATELHIHLNYIKLNQATKQVLMYLPSLFPSVKKLRLTGRVWKIEVKMALKRSFNIQNSN